MLINEASISGVDLCSSFLDSSKVRHENCVYISIFLVTIIGVIVIIVVIVAVNALLETLELTDSAQHSTTVWSLVTLSTMVSS